MSGVPIIGDTAAKMNIVLQEGVDWDKTLTYRDSAQALIDLTGYSAQLDIKVSKKDTTALDSLTDGNGRIVLGGTGGTIRILFTPAQIAALVTAGMENGVYNLILTDGGGAKDRILEGHVTIDAGV